MPSRAPSPSPGAFRLRNNSQSAPVSSHNDALFPKVFEDAWGSSEASAAFIDSRSDIERARIFLLRFAKLNPDPLTNRELQSIVLDPDSCSVPALAYAVQNRIYSNRHESFDATPLLQCVRFMLIKARVAEYTPTPLTKAVMDFFFDPTLARSVVPPPHDAVVYRYPSARLKVAIVGGGPTALASAISLAEKGRGSVEVHMWERRWVVKQGPRGSYFDYPPTARRRDQVVTLQDGVTALMSEASRHALFQGRPEAVWPGSANIQIRKVEDRLLARCQDPEFRGLINLYAEGVTREDLDKVGDFHVLLGADGAASWVRKSYFHGYENERGRSYALGLAFNRPAGLPWSQPLNVFLTLGQTRYLLNASDFDGRGYLNMQLTEEEWERMLSVDGQPVTFGNPGCLRQPDGSIPEGFKPSQVFAPSEDREGELWRAISDGLKLFGFKEEEVINVVRIPIVVQAVREGVQYLPPQDRAGIRRPHALTAVAGDAAMTVHFWPGRGLNSGIKSGLALGDEIVHALNNGRFIGLQLDAMKEYNDFIMKLQDREHDKRSIPILNQSGSPEMLGWLLSKANTVPDNVAIEWLVGAMSQIADRLEQRSDWAFPANANVEPQLRIVLRQLESATLREMAVSFPWPTREMGGAEVLPIRSMKPEEKQRWLQQLWGLLRDEKGRETRKRASSNAGGADKNLSVGRFEAPRGQRGQPPSPLPSPLPSPAPSRSGSPTSQYLSPGAQVNLPVRSESTLRRSNATRALSPGPTERNLMVPGDEPSSRPRSPSLGGEVGLTRLLSVNRPGRAVLSDAMSLALFRVDDRD